MAHHFVWLGPLLVFVGSISYFLVFARFPGLRDFPWVNLPVVVIGVVLSVVGMRRAFDPRRSRLVKLTAIAGCVLSLMLALLFGAYIFYLSYRLPGTSDTPQVQSVAPDFALPDQNRSTIRLSDFRGQKVVVVFYRGHW